MRKKMRALKPHAYKWKKECKEKTVVAKSLLNSIQLNGYPTLPADEEKIKARHKEGGQLCNENTIIIIINNIEWPINQSVFT